MELKNTHFLHLLHLFLLTIGNALFVEVGLEIPLTGEMSRNDKRVAARLRATRGHLRVLFAEFKNFLKNFKKNETKTGV